MPTTTTITSLPPETFEQILFLLDPLDVAAISQTSRYFYDIVYSPTPSTSNQTQHPNPNQYLWRNLYLAQPFDDPLQCYSALGRRLIDEENDFDWKKELQEIIRARTIVESYSRSSPAKTTITAQDRIRALRALLNLVTYVPPLRSYEDLLKEDKMSANLMWVAAECRRGALLDPLPQNHSQSPARTRARENRNRLGSVFGSEELGGEDDDEDDEQVEETPAHDPPTAHELQLRAKLHAHLGLTPHDWTDEGKLESRVAVYTMANYNWGNEFGPFREVQGEAGEGEGDVALRVNWEHVHHIHRAISMKLLEVVPAESLERIRELDVFIYQLSFPYTQVLLDDDGEGEVVAGLRKEDKDDDHPHLESDWAGVTGQWKISFCFCDHGHLIRFNKALRSLSSSPPDLNDPHYPPEAHKLSQAEVLRTMTVSLRITKVVQNPEFPGRPTLYFGGELDFGNGGGNSVMNGWVRVVDDSDSDSEDEGRGGRGRENAAIRWHFVSGETGNPIWSGEGVQIGGVKSAFGVLGSWTTIFHDIDDPVGPFWLRKQLDSEPEADD